MSVFYVNGAPVTAESGDRLMTVLRDALGLTSVKDGCSEGACGACMILVDGKPMRACMTKCASVDGKSIVTVEGLSDREKAVYSYAFASVGAVQCGFCTPGMVISAKGLIDRIPDPTPADVKQAIRGNICRCTGYVKIEKAILLAASMLRENTPVPSGDDGSFLGGAMLRVDASEKTLGTAKYADDYNMDGMLYGSAVRSSYPRAKVLSIDVSEAKALPGVAACLTADDIPGERIIGHLKRDWDVMIPVGGTTHYLGDSVALIAAESREVLEAAKKLVKVEYEPLDGVFNAADAIKPGAISVHEEGNILAVEKLKRGDAVRKLAESAYTVTETFDTPFTEHAFLEPECAVAFMDGDTMRIISGDQGIYQTKKECSMMLGIPADKVRVTAAMVGGGFGGKEDMSVQHHAALLTYITGRPVKVKLSRAESILVHPKRHPMTMTFTLGCDASGKLTGLKARLLADTGAYASLGRPVLQRACTHAAGPYAYTDVDIEGTAVYTNNPPAGAFRGFGVTQSCFALESCLDLLAEKVGLTPFEIRYRNAVRPGDTLPNGQIADSSTALVEALDAIRDDFNKNRDAGIACAMKNSGLGVGVPDFGRAKLAVKDGRVYCYSSAACIGQGMGTVQVQMLLEATGLSADKLIYCPPDTALSPDSGNTTASRQTVFTGEAMKRAGQTLKCAMDEAGGLDALNGREFCGEYEGVTDPMSSDKPNPVSHVAYGYAVHMALLDDDGRVKKLIAVHDAGKPVNPPSLEGQIEGGVVMGMGYALTEDFPLDNGRPTAKFGTLGLIRSNQAPEVEVRLVYRETENAPAYGAKGVGEIASIPTAPAIACAYRHRDGIIRHSLPISDTPYSRKKG